MLSDLACTLAGLLILTGLGALIPKKYILLPRGNVARQAEILWRELEPQDRHNLVRLLI